MNRTTLITLGVLAAAVVAVVVLKNQTPPAQPLAKGLAQVAAATAAQKAMASTSTATLKPTIVAAPIGTGLARVVDMSAFDAAPTMSKSTAAQGSLESLFNEAKYLY